MRSVGSGCSVVVVVVVAVDSYCQLPPHTPAAVDAGTVMPGMGCTAAAAVAAVAAGES